MQDWRFTHSQSFRAISTADTSLGKLRGFTEEDVALYKALARGGAGLIIVNGPPILPITACQLNSFEELGAKTVTCLVDHDRTLQAKAQHWLCTFIDQIRVRPDASLSERQQ